MKNIDQFLGELSPALANTDYTERFKLELSDHLEDASYDYMIGGQTEQTAEALSLQNVGPAKNLAYHFNTTMKYKNTYHVLIEALLNGLLVFPFVFITTKLGQVVFEGYYLLLIKGKTPAFYGDGGLIEITDIPMALLSLLIVFVISLFIVIVVYRYTNKRLSVFIHEPKQKIYAALATALPAALLLLSSGERYVYQLNFDGMGGRRREEILAGLLSTGIVLATTTLAIYWSWLTKRTKVPKFLKTFNRIIHHIFGLVSLTCLLLAILFPESSVGIIKQFIDVIVYSATFSIWSAPDWLRQCYFIGILLLASLLSIWGVIQYLRKQSPIGSLFPWLRLWMFLYLSILLVSGEPIGATLYEPTLQWHVPATNVSESIKHHIFSPFNNLTDHKIPMPKNIESIPPYYNFYHIPAWKDWNSSFQIGTTADRLGYQIEYSNALWTVDDIGLTRGQLTYALRRQYDGDVLSDNVDEWPVGLSCGDQGVKQDLSSCQGLYYHNVLIVEFDKTTRVTDTRMNIINNTALLHLNSGQVYLISLPE